MINIYAVDLWVLAVISVIGMIVWYALARYSGRNTRWKRSFKTLSVLMAVLAIYGILVYTVFHRNIGEPHRFVFINQRNHEFFRELFMNGLLYLPLGIALSVFIGPWTILAAFMISVGIETWQYLTGAGLAQGTDVIMNTLGAAVGTLPIWINKKMKAGKHQLWKM